MRIFVTGATGFLGSYLIPELIEAGHQVTGLSRSDSGADMLTRAGARVVKGDLRDLDRLQASARAADGVIHAAFNHDYSKLKEHSEEDRNVIEALGEALVSTHTPLIISSGTGLVDRTKISGLATETDITVSSDAYPRAATEEAADAIMAKGVHVIVIRLSQVHDTARQGRIAEHIKLAREKGYVAYVGKGENRLPAVHVTDAVRLYRLALECGNVGERFHAVGEEGIAMHEIARVLGKRLRLPVRSITPEEAKGYFGRLSELAQFDLAASGALTRKRLGWKPSGTGLLADLSNLDDRATAGI